MTELGQAQAAATGRALAARCDRIDAAISGDLARQRETLTTVLDVVAHEVVARTDPRWNEYDINTILSEHEQHVAGGGRELQRSLDTALSEWITEVRAPSGRESYGDYRRRCAEALDTVRGLAGPGQTAVVVSSAGTITQIVAQLWGVSGPRWQIMSRTMINASVTKLIVGRGGVSVVSVNEHAHLESLDPDGSLMTFR
ncbi:Broad specificity phosphatase PhoE [Williamsia sterculiae]|uniref:Broad specificity phosphatase PhoE n=1 Tax=Williamsia sterculiae TaxID=1344003 RepID=A0A1N7HDA9_9NOCA|nr:Broad specificity phosphatase PhoE [Williamsia sterculiae]